MSFPAGSGVEPSRKRILVLSKLKVMLLVEMFVVFEILSEDVC